MANILQKLFQRRKALPEQRYPTGAFRFIGGQLIPYKHDKLTYIERGYTYNDIVFAVVKKILDKAVCAPWASYKVVDEKSYFAGKAILKKISTSSGDTSGDYQKAMRMMQKGLVRANDSKLDELLQFPNENETFADLNYSHWGYKLVTGDYYEAGWSGLYSDGLNAGKLMQLYTLPPQYMSILGSQGLPLTEAAYLLQLGTELPFTREDILHEKYWNPEWDIYGNQLYGMSPLKAYLKRLQRNNLLQVRGGKMAQNGGADVAVYLDDARITSEDDFKLSLEQSAKLKQTWQNEQKGVENAGSTVWSPFKLGAVRLGLTAVEMDMLAAEEFDLKMGALIYNAPPVLFSTDASTYNNMLTGERSLTANCAMPLILSRESSFNRKLRSLPAYKRSNVIACPDFSVFTELEANKKETVDWLEKSGLPTYRKYEILGEERPPEMNDEEWNAVIIPSGWQLMGDLFMQPTDITGDINALDRIGANPYSTT